MPSTASFHGILIVGAPTVSPTACRRRRARRGDWQLVTQGSLDAFAQVTGEEQFVHVDVAQAKQTPFGGTIAHGYCARSLGRTSGRGARRRPSRRRGRCAWRPSATA
jgi:acyl dehydratase